MILRGERAGTTGKQRNRQGGRAGRGTEPRGRAGRNVILPLKIKLTNRAREFTTQSIIIKKVI